MKFFNIDFHVSVIADVRHHLARLGHQVDSLSLSNHCWVFGCSKDRVPSLEGMSTTSFGQAECDRFQAAEHRRLDEYDGFIVTHTPCLAGLYEATGKPVICVVSTRYDQMCRTPESKAWLNEKLSNMHGTGQLVLLANNAYDAWHVHRHLGIRPEIVPSLCDYTGVEWSGPKAPAFLHGRKPIAGLAPLPTRHHWKQVSEAACCVAIPYNVSLMSLFERHTMGMPILMPSKSWTLRHPESLSELVQGRAPKAAEFEAALRLSDWHSGELPGITFFDSRDDIHGILRQGVPPVTGRVERAERVLESWRRIMEGVSLSVSSNRAFPRSSPPVSPSVDALAGCWRWSEQHVGILRPDGAFIQLQEEGFDHKVGTWQPAFRGIELDLPGQWKRRVVLSTTDHGLWYPEHSSKPEGFIFKTDAPLSPKERSILSCDSYRTLARPGTFVLNTENLEQWYRQLRPDDPFTLVTIHSGTPVDERFAPILDDPRLLAWFACNASIRHPKLKPIPLGVRPQSMLWPDHSASASRCSPLLYDGLLAAGRDAAKIKMFSAPFYPGIDSYDQRLLADANGFPKAETTWPEYISDIAASRFCLIPDGCGIDSHRTWEALCCRTIPVIIRNPLVEQGLYDGLPIVVLDRRDDFKPADFDTERYERMIRNFDPDAVCIERWIDRQGGIHLPATHSRSDPSKPPRDSSENRAEVSCHRLAVTSHARAANSYRETPPCHAGYYRWNEMFYGEFLSDGTFYQHSVLNPSDKKPGEWWYCDGKLWFTLTGYWTKYAELAECGPSRLFLLGRGEFGTISKIDEADKYYAAPKVSSDSSIPRIIHACWFSGTELGELQNKCVASWKRHLPDYDIIIWDGFSWNPDKFLFSKEAFENRQWAFVSDVHRLDVLHRYGGIYLDLDVEVKKSFDPLLSHEFFTGTEPTNGICLTITPYIMGCKPNNPLVKELLKYYSDRHFINPDGTFDRKTNTSIIHETMIRHGAKNRDNIIDEFIPGHFRYPSWVLAYNSHLSYAVHHFDGAWLRQPKRQPSRADRAAAFRSIYDSNSWTNGSGPGSTPEYTEHYREFLSNYMEINRIKSVLDVGCGDWQFSRLIDWSGIDYLGVDIVPEVIESNSGRFGRNGIRFQLLDFVDDEPPQADLVIIKDVLQHLSLATAESILEKFTNHPNVLIIQDTGGVNRDCSDGGFRPLNITLPPFNLAARKVFDFGKDSKMAYEWRPRLPVVDRVREVLRLLANTTPGHTIRYGPRHDGGYVVPSLDFDTIITIGVGADVRFEAAYARIHSKTRFSFYDPTIAELPEAIPNSGFQSLGLGPGLTRQLVPLQQILSMSEIHPDSATLLKIDCEGGEWDCDIEHADLSSITAVVLEIHDIGNVVLSATQHAVLSKIFSEFKCLNVHPNNHGGSFRLDDTQVPRVLELTFLRKEIAQTRTNSPENHPCNPKTAELSVDWHYLRSR